MSFRLVTPRWSPAWRQGLPPADPRPGTAPRRSGLNEVKGGWKAETGTSGLGWPAVNHGTLNRILGTLAKKYRGCRRPRHSSRGWTLKQLSTCSKPCIRRKSGGRIRPFGTPLEPRIMAEGTIIRYSRSTPARPSPLPAYPAHSTSAAPAPSSPAPPRPSP